MAQQKPTLQSVLLDRAKGKVGGKLEPAMLPPGRPPDPDWDPKKYSQ